MFNPVIHEELTRDETSGHDHPRPQAREEPTEARLLREHLQPVGHRPRRAVTLVDLGE